VDWYDFIVGHHLDAISSGHGTRQVNLARPHNCCWIPSLSLGNRARAAESEWAELDEHQIRTLNMLERASYLLVKGGAGSGKTLIARGGGASICRQGRESSPDFV
jgi:hypothetical protein